MNTHNAAPQANGPNVLTEIPARIMDLGRVAWHGFRERRLDSRLEASDRHLEQADHDIDFYNEHAFTVSEVIDRDFDGRNHFPVTLDPTQTAARGFPVPQSTGPLVRQAESAARIRHYRDEVAISGSPADKVSSNIRNTPKPRVEVDVSRYPGQPLPRNRQQRREERRITKLVNEVRDLRQTQYNDSKIFGAATQRSGSATLRARISHGREARRDFKEGTIDAFELQERTQMGREIRVGKTPHVIHKQERKLERKTEGSSVGLGPVEKLSGKAMDAKKLKGTILESQAVLEKKRLEHQRKLAEARARRANRRR